MFLLPDFNSDQPEMITGISSVVSSKRQSVCECTTSTYCHHTLFFCYYTPINMTKYILSKNEHVFISVLPTQVYTTVLLNCFEEALP